MCMRDQCCSKNKVLNNDLNSVIVENPEIDALDEEEGIYMITDVHSNRSSTSSTWELEK